MQPSLCSCRTSDGSHYYYSKHYTYGAAQVNIMSGSSTGNLPIDPAVEPGRVLLYIVLITLCILFCARLFIWVFRRPSHKPRAWTISSNAPSEEEMYGASDESKFRSRSSTHIWTVWGMLDRRIPFVDVSVLSALLALGYVVLNFILLLTVTIHLDLPMRMGYLAAANSCLLVLPATRNSIITLLVKDHLNHRSRSFFFSIFHFPLI